MARRPDGRQSAGKRVTVTLDKSIISCPDSQKRTVEAMGLRKIRQSVQLLDTPETRGMILKVRHLVTVTE